MEESELAELLEDMELLKDVNDDVDFPNVEEADLHGSADAFVGGQAQTQTPGRNRTLALLEDDFTFVETGIDVDVPGPSDEGNRTDRNPTEVGRKASDGRAAKTVRQRKESQEATTRSSLEVGGSKNDHACRILQSLRKGDGYVPRKSQTSRPVEAFRVFKQAQEIEGLFYSVRIPSSGEMLYLPVTNRNSKPARSWKLDKLEEEGGLLEAPIQDMIEDCRKEMAEASIDWTERIVEMMDVDPLALKSTSQTSAKNNVGSGTSESTLPWVHMYAPQKYSDLLTDEKMNREVTKWMKAWDPIVFGKRGRNLNPAGKIDQQPPESKVILLSGPPGGGKTTLAKVIAQHCGYRPLVVNASDDRTKSILETKIHDATTMKSMLGEKKPNCIILDEVDGMATSEGQGAMDAILKLVQQGSKKDDPKGDEAGKGLKGQKKKKRRKSKPLMRPLICICNDLYAPVLKSLRASATIFQFRGLRVEQLLTRLAFICSQEKVDISRKTLQALIDKSNFDVRVCLNTLQYLASQKPVIHTKDVENANVGLKDLKESCFDIWAQLMFQPTSKTRSDSGLLYKNLQDFGEFDLVCDGVLENLQSSKCMDPLLVKTSKVVENLATGLWFSDVSGYGLTQYLPAYLICASKQIGSGRKFKLAWPMKNIGLSRSLKANTNLVSCWRSKISPKVLARNMGSTAVLDLIPALKRILIPSIYSISPENMSSSESKQINAFASIMWQYSLKYDLSLTNQTGASGPRGPRKIRAFIPEIHEFHQYGHGDALPTSQITMQTINLAIENLQKWKLSARRKTSTPVEPRCHMKESFSQDLLNFEKENDVMMASSSDGHLGGGAMDESENKNVGGDLGITHMKVSAVHKRKGNWLEDHRRNYRTKLMQKALTGKKPPVIFLYDEGKTDSVRRAATLKDFVD